MVVMGHLYAVVVSVVSETAYVDLGTASVGVSEASIPSVLTLPTSLGSPSVLAESITLGASLDLLPHTITGDDALIAAVLVPNYPPGTFTYPYPATDPDSFAVDFATAPFAPPDAEPAPRSGPSDAISIWYEFTAPHSGDWVGVASGFANGATIELYAAPVGSVDPLRPEDVTFIATDGSQPLDVGVVTVSVATPVGIPLVAEAIDLGAVAVDVAPGLAFGSLETGTGIDLGLVTADCLATLVVVLGAGAGVDLGGVALDETAVLAEVLT